MAVFNGMFGGSSEGDSAGGERLIRFEDWSANAMKSAGVYSITDNHGYTGSFFHLFDDDTTSVWEFSDSAGAAEVTSTIVLDLGRVVEVSVATIYFVLDTAAGAPTRARLKIEYSVDNSSYTEWFDQDETGVGVLENHDKSLFNKEVRYLRLTIVSRGMGGNPGLISLRLLKILR